MKSLKSFRFLAFIMSLCILSGIVPVASIAADENPSISITSHTNGDVIESGTNVILQAEWNMGDISRVDFYANGDKIPGCINDATDALVWQTPASGTYSVKAIASHVGGKTEQSSPVEIHVKPKGLVKGFYSANDLNGWRNNGGNQYGEDALTTDNATLSPYSIKLTPTITSWVKYNDGPSFVLENHDNINLLLYFENVPASGVGAVNVNWDGPSTKMNTTFTPVNGLNKVVIPIVDDNVGDTVTGFALGFGNSGIRNAASVYINGIYYSDSADAAFTATPVIPDNQKDVCNELTKYRIKFNRPLANCLVADSAGITVSGVIGTSAVVGTDYIDVSIPASSLNYNTQYTVTIPSNTIVDCYGNTFAGTSFNFTTIDNNCDGAASIPTVSFPKNNSTVSSSTSLVSSVVFNDNVESVGFYEGDVLIGSAGVNMDDEYILAPSTPLAAGSHTIKAKVQTKSGDVYESSSVTFDVVSTNYQLVGLENNDTVIVNTDHGNTVSVIDAQTDSVVNPGANASNVDKIVFYINGVKYQEDNDSPYACTLPLDKLGVNKFKAQVYDTIGGVTTFERTYNAAYAYESTSWSEDFEGGNPVIPQNTISYYTNADGSYNIDIPTSMTSVTEWQNTVNTNELTGSNALYLNTGSYNKAYIKGTTTYLNTEGFNIALWDDELNISSGMNRIFFEFDYIGNYWTWNQKPAICLRESFKNEKNTNFDYCVIPFPNDSFMYVASTGSGRATLKRTHLGFELSWDNTSTMVNYKTYVEGIEHSRGTVEATKSLDPVKLVAVLSSGFGNGIPYSLDNIRVSAYSQPTSDWGIFAEEDDIRIFSSGESADAEITVVNVSADEKNFTNYVAVYNGNELESVTTDNVTLPSNYVSKKKYSVNPASGQTIRIFSWESSLKPVTLK